MFFGSSGLMGLFSIAREDMFSGLFRSIDRFALEHPRRLFVVLFAISLTLTFSSIFVLGCVFETNDDRIFSNILSGAYGSDYSFQTYFMSLGFTIPVSLLFSLLGTWVNWYVVVCLCIASLGFSTISYLLIRSVGAKAGTCVILAVASLFYYDQIVAFQWTKNSAFYAASGTLSLCMLLASAKEEPFVVWLAASFVTMCGFLIRFTAALEACGVLFPCVIVSVLLHVRKATRARESWMSFHREKVTVVAVAVFLVIAFTSANLLFYKTNDGWLRWDEFNDAKSDLLSFGKVPGYEENESAIHEAGLNSNDWTLLSRWGVSDDTVFTPDKLESLSSLKVPVLSSALSRVVDTCTCVVKSYVFVLSIALYVLLCMLSARGSNRHLFVMLGPAMICFGEVLALSIVGNTTNRVLYPPFVSLVFSGLFLLCVTTGHRSSLCRARHAKVGVHLPFLVFVLLIACIGFFFSFERVKDTEFGWRDNGVAYAIEEEIEGNKDVLFLIDRPTLSDLETKYMNPLHALDRGAYENASSLGGWLALTPVDLSTIETYSSTDDDEINGFKVLGSERNIRLIDGYNKKYIEQFVKDHYNPDFSLVEDSSFGDITIYKPQIKEEPDTL